MLVISQKKGEKLRIGRDITITILESKAGKVRLGIEAPQELEVMRESLYRERQQQGTQQGTQQGKAPNGDAPKADAPKAEAPKGEAPAAAPASREPESNEPNGSELGSAAGAADASSNSAQPA